MAAYVTLVVAQPVLAGRYLSGDYDAIGWHEGGGLLLMVAVVGALALALVHAGVGRGNAWPVPALVVLVFAQGFQVGTGYSRALAIHVPLGVFIVATVLALAAFVWSPAIRRRGPLARR